MTGFRSEMSPSRGGPGDQQGRLEGQNRGQPPRRGALERRHTIFRPFANRSHRAEIADNYENATPDSNTSEAEDSEITPQARALMSSISARLPWLERRLSRVQEGIINALWNNAYKEHKNTKIELSLSISILTIDFFDKLRDEEHESIPDKFIGNLYHIPENEYDTQPITDLTFKITNYMFKIHEAWKDNESTRDIKKHISECIVAIANKAESQAISSKVRDHILEFLSEIEFTTVDRNPDPIRETRRSVPRWAMSLMRMR